MPSSSLTPVTKQPVHFLIKERRLTYPAVAYAIGLEGSPGVTALRNCAYGITYPNEHILRELPKYFDTSIEDLFEARVLAGPPARGSRKRKKTLV